ncbi:MAG TPA: carboxymuconolactone decarboxylase family protein [Stellaceae bacterium]|nr:carboxymuconolactone decarboxylase family protein [Stellaceae bacterium]
MTNEVVADPLAPIRAALPDFAADMKANLDAVLVSPNLTSQQLWGVAVASAIAARNPVLRTAIAAAARPHLSDAALAAAQAAASLMGMSNVYYRFLDLLGKDTYQAMPARLRMKATARPGIERNDFELMALAVSAINGCAACIAAHERSVTRNGITPAAVQDTVRIAAVVAGVASALEASQI